MGAPYPHYPHWPAPQYSAPPLARVAPGATQPNAKQRSRGAYRWLWFTICFFVVMIGLGLAWDRAWHATHVFDTFFSPPHVFTYSMVALTAALVATLTFSWRLRVWFGPAFRLPPFPFPVPGALALTGAGLVTLALAGTLDAIWHTAFGLDETGWSAPHAMIGWGLLVAMLGFVSCRLSLTPYRPLHWYSALVLGYLALSFSLTPFTGPLGSNHDPQLLQAVARLPILLAQPPAQHTFRIYRAWNLTRTNPIFIPLVALWGGAALGLLRRLDKRAWVFGLTLTLWSLLTLSGDHNDALKLDAYLHLSATSNAALWLPPPILPAALAFLLGRLVRLPERWAWALAGLVFGALAAGTWDPGPTAPLLALLAAPVLTVGAALGSWVYDTLAQPLHARARILWLAGVALPFLTGAVDLYLRAATP